MLTEWTKDGVEYRLAKVLDEAVFDAVATVIDMADGLNVGLADAEDCGQLEPFGYRGGEPEDEIPEGEDEPEDDALVLTTLDDDGTLRRYKGRVAWRVEWTTIEERHVEPPAE